MHGKTSETVCDYVLHVFYSLAKIRKTSLDFTCRASWESAQQPVNVLVEKQISADREYALFTVTSILHFPTVFFIALISLFLINSQC